MWLAAIKRDDLTDSIIKNQRVCSKHFIGGKNSFCIFLLSFLCCSWLMSFLVK